MAFGRSIDRTLDGARGRIRRTLARVSGVPASFACDRVGLHVACSASRLILTVCVAGLLSLAPFACLKAQTGRIEGTVTHSQTGEAVVNAWVRLVGTGWAALTDGDGYYVIENIPVGVYDVRVQADGFEPVEFSNHRVVAGQAITVNFELRQTGRRGEVQADVLVEPVATQPGLGVGARIGTGGLVGAGSRPLRRGGTFEGFARYELPFGLFVVGGMHTSTHEIEQATSLYRLTGFYLETRYAALAISSRWAPFVAARAGVVREGMRQASVRMTASGYSLGGGGGMFIRVTHQVAIEISAVFGAMRFDDYTFRGELKWKECLDGLESGTPLPESIVHCTGSSSGGLDVAILCYPPYFPTGTSSCTPPEIPYANTGRSAKWLGLSVGLHLSFSGP